MKWDRRHKQWRSSVVVDGKQEALGLFASEIDAAKAYDAAAAKHNKPLNFVAGGDPGDGSAASGDGSQRNKSVSSNYVGVSFNRKNQKWLTQITESGKQVYLGSFNTELEAARKYDEAAAELGKPLNLPDEGSNAKRAIKGKARAESEGAESGSGASANSSTTAAAAGASSQSSGESTTASTKDKSESGDAPEGAKAAGAEAAAGSVAHAAVAAAAAPTGTPGSSSSSDQPAGSAPSAHWSQSQPFMHLPGQPAPAAPAPPPYPSVQPPPLGPAPVFGMPPGYVAPPPAAISGGGDESRPAKKRKGKQDGNEAADGSASAAGHFETESAVI